MEQHEPACAPAGWHRVEERSLTGEETAALRALARRYGRIAIIAGAGAPLAFLGWIVGMAESSSFEDSGILLALFFIGPMAVFALWLLWVHDASRRSAGLRKDLRRGAVDRYEGRPKGRRAVSDVERRLLASGLLRRDDDVPQMVEVLRGAHAVWRVNDVAPGKLRFEPEPIALGAPDEPAPAEKPESRLERAWGWFAFVLGWWYLAGMVAGSIALPGPVVVRYVLGALIALASIIGLVGAHEGGHLLVGWLVGMRFAGCQVGPFVVRRTARGLRPGWFSLWGYNTGMAQMVVAEERGYRWRDGVMSAAGPLASLFVAIALYAASEGFWRPDVGSVPGGEALRMFALFSLIYFAFSALPISEAESGFATDGAQLLAAWKDPDGARHKAACSMLIARVIAGQRPRDWEADLLAQASDDAWGHLMLFYHHLDAGREGEAKAALEAGLAAQDVPFLHHEAAFYAGLFAHDAPEARAQLAASGERDGGADAWRAEAAVLLAEGDAGGARAAVAKARKGLSWEPGAGLAAAKEGWLRRIDANAQSLGQSQTARRTE